MTNETSDIPMNGVIPYAIGQASIVRIPVPGSNQLAIELKPRGFVPKSGSTSTLFIQDVTGKRHLRLDYGFNKATNTINYHWNQSGTNAQFGIGNHQPAGQGAGALYHGARYFRYAGRILMVVGVVTDAVSIVRASNPIRRASEVVAGWAAAWAGCKVVGAGGAAVGSLAPGAGTAIGGVGGCIIGGIGGYWVGSTVAGQVYDWSEDTLFSPLQEARAP